MRTDDFIITVVLILFAIHLLTIFLYLKFGFFKGFYHDFMGWCEPDETEGFNGVGMVSTCRHCKKRILEDGHGGWFPSPVQDKEDSDNV